VDPYERRVSGSVSRQVLGVEALEKALETVVAKRVSLRQAVWPPERQNGATMKEMRELTIRRDV
jgi:hypothetical protein